MNESVSPQPTGTDANEGEKGASSPACVAMDVNERDPHCCCRNGVIERKGIPLLLVLQWMCQKRGDTPPTAVAIDVPKRGDPPSAGNETDGKEGETRNHSTPTLRDSAAQQKQKLKSVYTAMTTRKKNT